MWWNPEGLHIVCFGAVCALENLVAMVIEALNPWGFPNDWQKHTFNPLQGAMFFFHWNVQMRSNRVALFSPFLQNLLEGRGGHLIHIESSLSLCVSPPQLPCSDTFLHSGPVPTTLCTNCWTFLQRPGLLSKKNPLSMQENSNHTAKLCLHVDKNWKWCKMESYILIFYMSFFI